MFKKILAIVAMLFTVAAMAAVDVNKATEAELDSVKGIGPDTSKLIITERKKGDFKSWDDLITRVKGVGEKRAENLSEAGLTVGGAAYKPAATVKKDEKAAAKEEKKDAKAAAKEEKKDAKAEAKTEKKEAKADAKATEAKADAKADAKVKESKADAKAKDAKAEAKADEKSAKVDAAKPAASATKK
jgi:competence protein ComEA